MNAKSTALITGASTGIGAVYADRLARRRHNLVLVARDAARLQANAQSLEEKYGIEVDVIVADLTRAEDLQRVEARLRDDARIGVLVNNAGVGAGGSFLDQRADDLEKLIGLNAIAVTRLARAVAPRFAANGHGAIINIGSVVGLAPEIGMTVYGATKAFVLYLTQGLDLELGPKGIYVQAVLPAATRTEIWERSGLDVTKVPNVMEPGELVDAALVGFDRHETVTIPPLPDVGQWDAHEAARKAMLPNFGQEHAASRYRVAA